MKIGTIVAGTKDQIKIDWVPGEIVFSTGVGGNCPTLLQVNVNGRGIVCDLDADGIKWAARLRRVGFVIGDACGIVIADGIIKGRTTTITIDNTGGAADIEVFGTNLRNGSNYIQSFSNEVLGKSGVDITKFTAAGFPSSTPDDIYNVTYADGLVQQVAQEELPYIATYTQNSTDSQYANIVDNFDQTVSKVNFIPNVSQKVYIQRVVPENTELNVKITNN